MSTSHCGLVRKNPSEQTFLEKELVKNGEKETKPRTGVVNFERRKYPRFSVDLPIEYSRIDSPISHTGRGLNISEGGLLIHFLEKMDLSQYLRLKLFFPLGSELNTIEVLAEVAWTDIHLGESWGDYRCGVRFIDISPEDMTKFKKFLSSLSG
jgi:c-di-GMP-binding flagellar brake protein YcgR